ncbi:MULTISPECIES: hypothetical protein [Nocardioides]|uniref:DUF4328 domain-containing protein n=1 Tax=Nocardioides vastitatis TaxID=2568655 RepID=A0ABW0ZKX4_9ACTN|nr:hypothetical protein [Nocardioides sp.]THJ07462.1 hypothetical protein E7Z54_05370 [Nocardioides sp.]
MSLSPFPGFWIALFTLGIARASWISSTNRTLGRGGAGFLFAWFLPFCANYGVTGRLNETLAAAGSSHRESPWLVFWLTGWPFIGSKKRIRRAVSYLNDAHRVHQSAAVA